MKILALTLLCLTSTLTGQYIAYRMVMRVHLLEKFELMLNTVLCEIRFLSTPASEIVNILCLKGEFDDLVFLKFCSDEIAAGSDFREAWMKSLEHPSAKKYFKNKDMGIIRQFGNQFGTTDTEGQISICTMHLESVKTNILESRSKKEQYANLIFGLSFLCGIGIIIVFI